MRPPSRLFFVFLAIALPMSLFGQVICPSGFPASSPVLSSGLDDIPATNDHLLTYTGAHAAGTANHNMSFMQTSPNEQKVWFFTDNASLDHEHIYYNRRYRANSSSPWYWEFSVSPAVTSYGATAGAVLYSAAPRYVDTRTNTAYSYVMYQVVQPPECIPESAGYMQVVFSNDGICWTNPRWATRVGGPMSQCLAIWDSVPVEQVTAIDDGTDIKLIGVEGSIPYLSNYMNMNETAVIGYSPAADPSRVYLYEWPKVTALGVVSPYTLHPWWSYSYENRFQPYNYFMNLQAAYDSSTGDLYIGRGYPYPFDRGPGYYGDLRDSLLVPGWGQADAVMMWDPHLNRDVQVGGCNSAPATLPNRIQVYKMHIGSMSNFAALGSTSSYWTLLSDLGGETGYGNSVDGYYYKTALTYPQTNAGRDYATVSFVRDGQGNLVRENGVARYFGGDSFESLKTSTVPTNQPCNVTGLERETLLAIP